MRHHLILIFSFLLGLGPVSQAATMAELLAASQPTDWRPIPAENILILELASGQVLIELAPDYAPRHVRNIQTLSKENYWDGLAIVRVQDNYVVQWGDPDAEDAKKKKKIRRGRPTLAAEFDKPLDSKLGFTPLGDGDVYAPEVGFASGFPVARDLAAKKTWLLHCYGAVGAGRNTAPDSGGGAELYTVIGHSPRHLDRNVTLVGRVIEGIELLSALPRGTGPLGFYEKPEQRIPIRSIRLAKDLPAKERPQLEALKTDSAVFRQLIEARRHRKEEWFHHSAGHIEICNVPLPVRHKLASKSN